MIKLMNKKTNKGLKGLKGLEFIKKSIWEKYKNNIYKILLKMIFLDPLDTF